MKKGPAQAKKKKVVRLEPRPAGDIDALVVEGLKQNNLKDLSFSIPHNCITAVVGPSGSGKSSLAFDTLFAEGRWRFIESLSTYTRLFLERMDRPELENIRNIRPAIAIEQKNPVRTSRSTVATATEIYDYLRLLFARVGKTHCTGCGSEVVAHDPETAARSIIERFSGKRAVIGFALPKDEAAGHDELFATLLKKGFIRVVCGGGEVYDLSEERPEAEDITGKGAALIAVADRVVAGEKERTRIAEAVSTSYNEGGGEALVLIDGGQEPIRLSRSFKCADCDMEAQKPAPILFSFNHPVGACPECKGFGNILSYNEDRVVPDRRLTLREGAIEPWTKPSYTWWQEELEAHAEKFGIDLDTSFDRLSERELRLVREGTEDFDGIDGFFAHLEGKKYKLHIRVFLSRYKGQFSCEACRGTRLKESALSVKVAGLDISEVTRMTIKEAREFFLKLELPRAEAEISKEILKQIGSKLEFLNQTGLGYIALERLTRTLSGGESQRVSLANQIGSTLSGVLYILDEPSIGLHPRDIDMLIGQVKRLAARGNTVVMVEHDPSVIMSADHIVELGPGAGEKGGRLVYSGEREEFLKTAKTLTSDYLTGRKEISVPRWRRNGDGTEIVLKGATGNNLKGVDFTLPLKTITCVTGVSGSGKSTLVMDTLYNALAEHFGERAEKPLPYESLKGAGQLGGVKLINQEPIGRTPRSNPITYIGGFDDIRRFFAGLPGARGAGLAAGAFSFNVPGGRCEACKGEGVEKLEMYFLPDVYIQCPNCSGRRYKPQVLDVTHKGRNIYDVLNMTFEDASHFIPATPVLEKKFSIIKDVGLGYLRLGQPATTLSGGEAQRLKIAKELSTNGSSESLYILDEPTTGLHTDDAKKLLSVLGRLTDSGNTVLIVEHNLDCIKTADHIVDLGPEGGDGGGRIVAEGDPEEVAESTKSHTGRYLKELL